MDVQLFSLPPVKEFSSLRVKLQNSLQDLKFLLQCRDRGVIPKFITVKSSIRLKTSEKILHSARKKLLSQILQEKRAFIARIEDRLYRPHLELTTRLLPVHFDRVDVVTWHRAQSSTSEKEVRHKRKLRKLLSDKQEKSKKSLVIPVQLPDPIVNISGVDLTSTQKEVLNLGLNFAIERKKKPFEEIVSELEAAIGTCKDSIQENIRFETINILNRSTSLGFCNLKGTEFRALRDLKQSNLIVTKADKGGRIVVLNETQYNNGINSILDNGAYKKIKLDPTNRIVAKLKLLLKNCTIFSESEIKGLVAGNVVSPKIYALPKLHKPDIPFRPIISNIGSPTYLLAQRLVKRLSGLTKVNKYTIKNSADLIEKLKGVSLKGKTMMSFDIKAMFSNIPINQALNCLKRRLNELKYDQTECADLLKLTEFCLSNTYFQYRENFFQQEMGLSMGNPLSPTLCEIFMDYFEESALTKFGEALGFWGRFVDDTLAFVQNDVPSEVLLQHLNSINPVIQFTVEIEENNKLNFLDITLERTMDDTIRTTVYRKPDSVYLFPHSRSAHPFSQKLGVYKTLIHRAKIICSDLIGFATEINFIKNIAVSRGFSANLIDNMLRKRNLKRPLENVGKIPLAVLPFSSVTDEIAKVIKKHDVKVVFKPKDKVSTFLCNGKDKTDMIKKQGIYQIPCKDCELKYVGQTKRSLEKRKTEHHRHCRNRDIYKSAVAMHEKTSNHTIDWDAAKIIAEPKYFKQRNIRESIEITKLNNELMNIESGPYLNKKWVEFFSSSN